MAQRDHPVRSRHRRWRAYAANSRRWGPGLLLVLPSIVLIAVFVYGLIGWNIKTSLGAQPIYHGPSGTQNYTRLFDEAR